MPFRGNNFPFCVTLSLQSFCMASPRKLLMILAESAHGRRVLAGVHNYCRSHGTWEYHLEPLRSDVIPRSRFALQEWRADGVIAQVTTAPLSRLLAKCGVPAVNVGGYVDSPLPSVIPDNPAIGRLVARHFIDNGYWQFGYCSLTPERSPRERCEAFVAEVRRAGFNCDVFADRFVGQRETDWGQNRRRMEKWLRSVRKPVAIMCSHDQRGKDVSWTCRRFGIKVPGEVAIAAVGDDQTLCDVCTPPMSSVDTNAERIGFEAARLVDRLLSGRTRKTPTILIPPRRLVVRASSDLVAVNDPETASAVRFIRENAYRPIGVEDVVDELTISRRSLERRFLETLGRSPKAEITRLRIARAQELLADTNLPGATIAQRSGFTGPDKFSAAFRRECGHTPSDYRRLTRKG